jgi:phytoene synthase
MPDGPTREAYEYCRRVTQQSSTNFYYAFRLLPPQRRAALYAVYAFCRFTDDITDDHGPAEARDVLDRWREELDRIFCNRSEHPIGLALQHALRTYPLARENFEDLIRGVEQDLLQDRYETFEDLRTYCYRVASTVGLLCIEVFGYRHPEAKRYAVELGLGMQLTNILRDVKEDAERGRIYLPLEDLRRFGVREAELLAGQPSDHVVRLLAFECERARSHYRAAREALHPEDRRSLAPAEAMRLIYERLLARIEATGFDVFGLRVTLPAYEKLTLALAAWGRSQLGTWVG